MGIYELGEYIEVHPTFLYESIATFILFLILIRIKDKRKFKGQLTCIYFIGYGFVRMIIEGLRTDSLMIGQVRVSQILSAIIFISASALYIKKNKNRNRMISVFCLQSAQIFSKLLPSAVKLTLECQINN